VAVILKMNKTQCLIKGSKYLREIWLRHVKRHLNKVVFEKTIFSKVQHRERPLSWIQKTSYISTHTRSTIDAQCQNTNKWSK